MQYTRKLQVTGYKILGPRPLQCFQYLTLYHDYAWTSRLKPSKAIGVAVVMRWKERFAATVINAAKYHPGTFKGREWG